MLGESEVVNFMKPAHPLGTVTSPEGSVLRQKGATTETMRAGVVPEGAATQIISPSQLRLLLACGAPHASSTVRAVSNWVCHWRLVPMVV